MKKYLHILNSMDRNLMYIVQSESRSKTNAKKIVRGKIKRYQRTYGNQYGHYDLSKDGAVEHEMLQLTEHKCFDLNKPFYKNNVVCSGSVILK